MASTRAVAGWLEDNFSTACKCALTTGVDNNEINDLGNITLDCRRGVAARPGELRGSLPGAPGLQTPSRRQGHYRRLRRSEALAAGDDRCAGRENFLPHGWGTDGGRKDRGANPPRAPGQTQEIYLRSHRDGDRHRREGQCRVRRRSGDEARFDHHEPDHQRAAGLEHGGGGKPVCQARLDHHHSQFRRHAEGAAVQIRPGKFGQGSAKKHTAGGCGAIHCKSWSAPCARRT
jgi:hypothetical protein